MSTDETLITTMYPVTLYESAYARAEHEGRPWYLIYRPSSDTMGITANLEDEDEVIMECEPDS